MDTQMIESMLWALILQNAMTHNLLKGKILLENGKREESMAECEDFDRRLQILRCWTQEHEWELACAAGDKTARKVKELNNNNGK
jgi:hypothetical protein